MKTLLKLLKNGWSRRQIAGALFLSYGAVQKWGTGKRGIPSFQQKRLEQLPLHPPAGCPLAEMRPQGRKTTK